MNLPMRSGVITLVVAFLLLDAAPKAYATPSNEPDSEPAPRSLEIEATPLFDAPQVIERLEIRQVLHLRSEDPGFGGLSGMVVAPDGATVLTVSDRGDWLHLQLSYADDGRIAGIPSATIGPILTPSGRPVEGRMEHDAESMIMLGDSYVVGFEGDHRLWRYACTGDDVFACRPTVQRPPRAIRRAGENNGFEAVATLADGRVLILAEELIDRRGRLRGWISAPRTGNQDAKRWRAINLPVDGAYRPTSLIGLANGDAVLVERSYSAEEGVRIRISKLAGDSIRPGRTLTRDVIARLDDSLAPVDNLEAGHAIVDAAGNTTIFVISDDNFSDRQRTLLFELRLLDPP